MRYITLLCGLLAALAACSEKPIEPPDVYTVRGVVRQLPDPSRPASEFQVRHEALPGFKNKDGEVVGMKSMTMPFPPADPALLAGLAVGDKLEFRFEVRWSGDNPLRVTEVEKLPPETRLAFEADE